MGGTIGVESELGEGTRFAIRLPREAATPASNGTAPTLEPAIGDTRPRQLDGEREDGATPTEARDRSASRTADVAG